MYDVYEIEYPDKGIKQKKVLLPTEIYTQYRSIEDEDEAKAYLKLHTFGLDYFIEASPFYKAIETGILELPLGTFPCIVRKI